MASIYITLCPVCEELIELDAVALGNEVECPECGELFVITSTDPLELSYAYDLEDEGEFYDEERRT